MARRNKRNAGGRETAARPDYKKTHRKLILTCVITLLGVLAAVAFLLWYLESGKTGLETAGAGSGEEIVAAPVDNPASQLRALLRSRDLAGAEALYEQTVRGNAAQEARVDAALFAEFDRLAERVRVENYPQTTALEHMENMLPYVKDERMHAFLSDRTRRRSMNACGRSSGWKTPILRIRRARTPFFHSCMSAAYLPSWRTGAMSRPGCGLHGRKGRLSPRSICWSARPPLRTTGWTSSPAETPPAPPRPARKGDAGPSPVTARRTWAGRS